MSEKRLMVSLITPTYNEKENVPLLAEEVFKTVGEHPDIDLELIVVDDNSPDGTGQVAEELSEHYPIQVVHREKKLGLGSAVMAGFQRSDRPLLGVIDADLSHDPIVLPQLIQALRDHDLTIGSRYQAGSQVEDWPWYRQGISQAGVFFAQRLTGVKDPLSGYFFLHREVLNDLSLTSHGYKILLEILIKGRFEQFVEIPFTFRNREYSTSKLNFEEYYLFAKQLLVFWAQSRRNRRK
ncbi:MAG: polyprenol monophosphomannose synthase [Candidatus Latescibacteria bacterium]|nr:polyprenol monophosphomannose synthase [Candidatus Latescibacterota bacterium]